MKQVYTLPDGNIVLIDWVGEKPKQRFLHDWKFIPSYTEWEAIISKALKSAIPTLSEHKEQWLQLEGKKLEEGVEYELIERDIVTLNEGFVMDSVLNAIPIQKEDNTEDIVEIIFSHIISTDATRTDVRSGVKELLTKYNLTRKV